MNKKKNKEKREIKLMVYTSPLLPLCELVELIDSGNDYSIIRTPGTDSNGVQVKNEYLTEK